MTTSTDSKEFKPIKETIKRLKCQAEQAKAEIDRQLQKNIYRVTKSYNDRGIYE